MVKVEYINVGIIVMVFLAFDQIISDLDHIIVVVQVSISQRA